MPVSRTPRPAAVLRSTPTEPFADTQEAWIWTMQALTARREGARVAAGRGLVARPCEPDDVFRELDRLYRRRKITLEHARVLRIYGERAAAPDPKVPDEAYDSALWRGALAALHESLVVKGITRGAKHGR